MFFLSGTGGCEENLYQKLRKYNQKQLVFIMKTSVFKDFEFTLETQKISG